MEAATWKVLCLHGKHQCAEIFSQRLANLEKKSKGLKIQLFYIDAPFFLPLQEGQEVAMRCWYRSSLKDMSKIDNPSLDMKRDFDICLEQILKKEKDDGPFDGLLGFSQGAGLIHLLFNHQEALKFKFAVLCGGYSASFDKKERRRGKETSEKTETSKNVSSLHIIGRKDPVVSPKESEDTYSHFNVSNPDAVTAMYEHPQGHVFPTNKKAIDAIADFLVKVRKIDTKEIKVDKSALSEDVLDEIDALETIFPDMCQIMRTSPLPICLQFSLTSAEELGEKNHSTCTLIIELPDGYPETSPSIVVESVMSRLVADPSAACVALKKHMKQVLQEGEGMPVLFNVASEATEWLRGIEDSSIKFEIDSKQIEEKVPETDDEKKEKEVSEEEEKKMVDEATRTAAEFHYKYQKRSRNTVNLDTEGLQQKGGRWELVVGLVGKPSAGKSTFFNAVVDPEDEKTEARIAAFPFTTILPNVSTGYFAAECPSKSLFPDGKLSDTKYGRDFHGDRLIPIKIKDVAGLVPGAYKGRGKGNAFLNDLLDADVLIHILDNSGLTDKQGNKVLTNAKPKKSRESNTESKEPEVGDPSADIEWVREELHRWIFNNVWAKFDRVRKKPERIYGMLTGYHCTPFVVQTALNRMGISYNDVNSTVGQWTQRDLHMLVAHFLRVRFPILLALNKADTRGARSRANSVRKQFKYENVVEMSARAEWLIRKNVRRGRLQNHLRGSNMLPKAEENSEKEMGKKIGKMKSLFERLDGTGVHNAINTAVKLANPLIVYPVSNLTSCVSVSNRDTVLEDCLLMRQGSKVEDVYNTMKKKPYSLIDGDYIRAEYRVLTEKKATVAVLKKTDVVDESKSIVRIVTNKRVAWQAALHAKQATASSK
mmetsp:Transcript_9070/g.13604  ORF Transcript_9070/g.13604 Transcript_9070/m.13604 type:complete len:880 (+) Transcript_9070:2-2641(+)